MSKGIILKQARTRLQITIGKWHFKVSVIQLYMPYPYFKEQRNQILFVSFPIENYQLPSFVFTINPLKLYTIFIKRGIKNNTLHCCRCIIIKIKCTGKRFVTVNKIIVGTFVSSIVIYLKCNKNNMIRKWVLYCIRCYISDVNTNQIHLHNLFYLKRIWICEEEESAFAK